MADSNYDPPLVEYPEDFVPDQKQIDDVAQRLSVEPEWAKQGIYYSNHPNCFDEVCAWVLENHPRFVLVSTSNSPPPDLESDKLAMAFIVNAKVCTNTRDIAAEVAQALMEFYIKFKENEALQEWRSQGASKTVLQAEDNEKLYNLKAVADAYDLDAFYTTNQQGSQIGNCDMMVLVLLGDGSDVAEVTKNLPSV